MMPATKKCTLRNHIHGGLRLETLEQLAYVPRALLDQPALNGDHELAEARVVVRGRAALALATTVRAHGHGRARLREGTTTKAD